MWLAPHHAAMVMGSPCNDTKSSPKSEPSNPNVVYAVADKSRRRNGGKTKGNPGSTVTFAAVDKAPKQNSSKGDIRETSAQQKDSEQNGGGLGPKGATLSVPYTKVDAHTAPDMELREVYN